MHSELAHLHREHVAHLTRAYADLLAREGLDAVAIHIGSPRLRTRFDDQYWPLRPLPHFHHWLALVEPDAVLVAFADGRKPRLHRVRAGNFWENPPPFEAEFMLDSFQVSEHASLADVVAHLPAGRVALVAEDDVEAARLGRAGAGVNPPSLMRQLDALRVAKTPYELACLAQANAIAARGHRAVAELFHGGAEASELDLHLAYLKATAQDDHETPYKNIVALGRNAATLHHVAYGRRPSTRAAESLLLDAGATFLGYCSDITRTHLRAPTGATELSTFGALLAGMERLQRKLCDEAAVGLPYERLHDRSHEELGALLVDVGVVKTSAEEAVASGITRAFYPHGLGHSVGLQTHDVGCAELRPRADNPFLRNTTTIAPGQCFTIEPGVYFIDMLLRPLREGPRADRINWPLVDALAELGGVRIEDDVHVRAAGHVENLTRAVLPT
jgi:Xaa-Pro dipeptidase